MLHLIISTPRSGSNSLCKFLAMQHTAFNMYEPVTDNRGFDNELLKPIEQIVKETLTLSKISNTVVKFHIDHLLMLYPHNASLIVELLKSAKLYYCLRLNFAEQLKSIAGIKQTGMCDSRTSRETIHLIGPQSLDILTTLVNEISVMGEWFKSFPGELIILENMNDSYSKYQLHRYDDTYSYTYDSTFTQQFVEQHVDVLEIFNRDNSLYSLIGN